MNLHDRYVRYFTEERGFVTVESRTRKYTVLKGKDTSGDIYYFIGSRGAIRLSRKGYITQSYDCSIYIKRVMELWEEEVLKLER